MRAMVSSAISRADSAATTSPARIWPSSIMLATSAIPFITPRHALETSRISASPGRPRASAVGQAVAGSRFSRFTPA